jgi:hydroxymethylpyrimidine pyrophosphatase-like HAD family hydrolase
MNQPQYLAREQICMIDVDGTLIGNTINTYDAYTIRIKNPYSGENCYAIPKHRNANLVREWKARGRTIIVWSAGGHAWAKAVVEALKLTDSVDLIMEKPICYLDDLTANEFMGTRVFLK